jgi:two-component system, chemotaxis family, chemotaxis protein CheY
MATRLGPTTTMLVVDDNPHMRTILKTILNDLQNVTIREAADPIIAIETLRTCPVELVITDLAMPNMDGIAFARHIRSGAEGIDKFLPIIMVTGHTEMSRIHEARDAGVNEVLAKPINARALFERITMVMEHPRPYVLAPNYFGPCRRRLNTKPNDGQRRRRTDKATEDEPSALAG